MKRVILILVALLAALVLLQGCSSGGDNEPAVTPPVDDTVTSTDSASTVFPSDIEISGEVNGEYSLFQSLRDDGGFFWGDIWEDGTEAHRFYDLSRFFTLLKDNGIQIIDMKGSKNLSRSDGGSIHINDSEFKFSFSEADFAAYDYEAVIKEFPLNDLRGAYIQTEWGLFTFAAWGDGLPYTQEDWLSHHNIEINTIRVTHPEYVTERGIRIGSTLEDIETAYDIVFDNRSYKQPEENWSVSGDVGDGFVTFVGDDSGVLYIEVGGRYACAN